MERNIALEKLASHNAFALHIIAKWMSERSDIDQQLKDRLAVHLTGIEGALAALGHSSLRDEFEGTEDRLHRR